MEGEERRDVELVDSIKGNITRVIGIVEEIRDGLVNCASILRVEQSEKVFRDLSEGIKNLNHLIDFIKELKSGMEHLELKGYNVSMEPLSRWDKSLDIFNEMLSAFESQDWITLSDLIQYELQPFLLEGEKGLSELNESLQKI